MINSAMNPAGTIESGFANASSTGVAPEIERVVETIPPYKVIFLNDQVTTFDFVIRLLMTLFRKDHETALTLTHEVHNSGSCHVTTLPREQAELKQAQVHQAAHHEGFPFRCIIEPA